MRMTCDMVNENLDELLMIDPVRGRLGRILSWTTVKYLTNFMRKQMEARQGWPMGVRVPKDGDKD